MRIIDSVKSLLSVITEPDNEIITYGMGNVAELVVRYLHYNNLLYHICCISVKDISTNNLDFAEYYGLHAFSFRDLTHFRDTATVIVCTAEDKHREIENDLTEFGFQNIFSVSDECVLELRSVLQDKENNLIGKMNFRLSELEHNLKQMQYMIREQNEISEVNHKAFEGFKNKFKDKEITLIATGPSLKDFIPLPETINIGVNFAYRRKDIAFDYLFNQDYVNLVKNITGSHELKEVREAFGKVKRVFIGSYAQRTSFSTGMEFPCDIFDDLQNIQRYFFSSPYERFVPIYTDICNHSLFEMDSIVFPAMQFALFGAPKKIYIVGCDASSSGHFYKQKKDSMGRLSIQRIKLGWLRIKKFAEQFYPNTEIVSVNPVGLKGLFTDIYTSCD